MAEIHGDCGAKFGAVREALAASLEGVDVGASVAVYVEDELVVDLWGGYTDAARSTPWQRDTITNVWSTTKVMTAFAALVLADRGQLELDAPVARYWPEFAVAGKEDLLVRHVLAHTAGLPVFDEPMTVADLYDWPAATARLAAQTPHWTPGTAAGYHAITQGFLIGEVIRRITGLGAGEFFAAEVAGPLGADFHIGLAAEHDHRVAPVIPPPATPRIDRIVHDALGGKPNPHLPPAEGNSIAWRRAAIPSGGGFGNARSIGAVQSVLACRGRARGVRLMSPLTATLAWQEQFAGEDRVLGTKMRYGMGYGVFGNCVGWGGLGGSLVMIDLDARMTVAYAMNQMLDQGSLGDERGLGLMLAAYDGLT